MEERARCAGARRHLHQHRLHPSKALLQSSEYYEHAGHHFKSHGIEVQGLALDLAKMLARKDSVVKQNNDGILYLFKKNKITFFHGRGSFVGKAEAGYEITVAGADRRDARREARDRRDRVERARASGRRRSTKSRSCRTTARWPSRKCRSASA